MNDDLEPPSTLTTIIIFVCFVIPWLVGLGAIFNAFLDKRLW